VDEDHTEAQMQAEAEVKAQTPVQPAV
jgi:hypothetical protein